VPELACLPPIANEPLSVVLLAHNAEAHLHSVVTGWIAHLNGLKRDWELLLVDDGSSDRTPAIAAELAEQSPQVRLMKHATRQGEGAALRTAVGQARHPLLFYCLCDPRYRPGHLNPLLVEARQREPGGPPCPLIDTVHIAVASHAGVPVPAAWRVFGLGWRLFWWLLFNVSLGRSPGWLGWRRHLGWFVTRILFAIRNRDVSCPVRLLRREVFDRFPLQSDGSFVHAEILAKATFLTLLISEDVPLGDWRRPVPPYQREETATQWFSDLARVFWRPSFGSPPRPPQGN
jgi:glycosyltransferase involved in cell wall biosynthesis